MKTLFIPAKSNLNIDKSRIKGFSKELPKVIAIIYSIQYKEQAAQIRKILSKEHKITRFIQILGCSKPNVSKNTQALLLVGDGSFHTLSSASETNLPIYRVNNRALVKIPKREIEAFKKRQKGAYMKFLNAKRVGILVSSKPGQENFKRALTIKKKLKEKQSYLFLTNNIDTNEFENFGLDSWVNTACPRLDLESTSIINMDRIKS